MNTLYIFYFAKAAQHTTKTKQQTKIKKKNNVIKIFYKIRKIKPNIKQYIFVIHDSAYI